MIVEILNSLFGQTARPTKREVSIAPLDTTKSNTITKTTPNKYADDVVALQVFYKLEKGGKIEIGLQDLLAIAPRKRPRIEAYQGLVSYVKDYYGVELTIKSRKTK